MDGQIFASLLHLLCLLKDAFLGTPSNTTGFTQFMTFLCMNVSVVLHKQQEKVRYVTITSTSN